MFSQIAYILLYKSRIKNLIKMRKTFKINEILDYIYTHIFPHISVFKSLLETLFKMRKLKHERDP